MINVLLYQMLAYTIHRKILKVIYQIFKVILSTSLKNKKQWLIIRHQEYKKIKTRLKNVNKIKNRIIFKIKTGYYLELVTPETMKLHGTNTNKIT